MIKRLVQAVKKFLGDAFAPRVYYVNMTKEQAKQADKVFEKAQETFKEAEKLFKSL